MTSAVRCVGRLGLAMGLGISLVSTLTMAQATKPAASETPEEKTLTFSRDIAPVLVGNCLGCHGPGGRAVKKFDQSTFQKLMAGGESGKAIIPGKPEESELVLRVKGESEGRKMPPDNDKDLAPETIAKIEDWIRSGARLDPGPGHTLEAPLASYAATPESLKRDELAKMTPEQREEKLAAVARERWKKGSPNTTPETTSSPHFALFGLLPKDRAEATLKLLESQYLALQALLGRPGSMALNGPEKVSIYVFNEPTAYVEFVRGNENRDVEAGTAASANFGVETPYLAAADPLIGREDPNQGKRPSPSRKKEEDDFSGTERSLAGLLAEQMGIAATNQAGKSPRWLSYGIGAYMGSRLEPSSPYYRRLRSLTYDQGRAGWAPKATEALGDQTDDEKIRSMGFSLIEWLAAAWRLQFPNFVRGMLQGPEKLDDVIRMCFGDSVNRDQFLEGWGQWVAAYYRRPR
jgi:mono/diheme cytochrome c family protein